MWKYVSPQAEQKVQGKESFNKKHIPKNEVLNKNMNTTFSVVNTINFVLNFYVLNMTCVLLTHC